MHNEDVPTMWGAGWTMTKHTGQDVIAEGYQETVTRWDVATALEYFQESVFDLQHEFSVTARYLRVFHKTDVHLVVTETDPFVWAVVLDTPAWREFKGLERGHGVDVTRAAQTRLDQPRETVRFGAVGPSN